MAGPPRPLPHRPARRLPGLGGPGRVVAGNLSDFLWLLADGIGPWEAVVLDDDTPNPAGALPDLAAHHASTPRREPRTIKAEARAEFPDFPSFIGDLRL